LTFLTALIIPTDSSPLSLHQSFDHRQIEVIIPQFFICCSIFFIIFSFYLLFQAANPL